MFKIVKKDILSSLVKKIIIEAREISQRALPGQFVVIRLDEKGERIPLTIACTDKNDGLITLIFQEVGFTTTKLGRLNTGDSVLDILGPLGHPAEIKKYGTVVCVAGGVGVAEVLPVAQALRACGNKVSGIIGARSKDLLILEDQMKNACDELFIATDDGSYGQRGLVTDILKNILDTPAIQKTDRQTRSLIDLVYAIGPVPMMEAVSNLTLRYDVKTIVSLNPIMVDGTGMCGSCRVTVAGKVKFCCVDGPDFDGHLVDFKELWERLKLFKEQEKRALGPVIRQ